MKNTQLELMASNQPDYDLVREYFFEQWQMCRMLGASNYCAFVQYHAFPGNPSGFFNFWLMGAVQALTEDLDWIDVNTPEKCWQFAEERGLLDPIRPAKLALPAPVRLREAV